MIGAHKKARQEKNWLHYRDLFKALFHKRKDMDDALKLTRLCQYVDTDKVAAFSGAYTCGYAEVWKEMLKDQNNSCSANDASISKDGKFILMLGNYDDCPNNDPSLFIYDSGAAEHIMRSPELAEHLAPLKKPIHVTSRWKVYAGHFKSRGTGVRAIKWNGSHKIGGECPSQLVSYSKFVTISYKYLEPNAVF